MSESESSDDYDQEVDIESGEALDSLADDLVLVTSADGFIASHIVEALLDKGYRVRCAVKDPADNERCAHLKGLAGKRAVEIVKEGSWAKALEDCDYVIHTALSPVVTSGKGLLGALGRGKKNVTEDSNLDLLRAAAKAGVQRVCVTSSWCTVACTRDDYLASEQKPLTEESWSTPEKCSERTRGLVLAEKAAWEFIDGGENGRGMEMVVIVPGVVYGPVLNHKGGLPDSLQAPLLAVSGRGAIAPGFSIPAVDVRDVASAHVRALEVHDAEGMRFLVVNEVVTYAELTRFLYRVLRPFGYWWIPTFELPHSLTLLLAPFTRMARVALPYLGVRLAVDTSPTQTILGLDCKYSGRQAFAESAVAFVRNGDAKKTAKLSEAAANDPGVWERLPRLRHDPSKEQRQNATRTLIRDAVIGTLFFALIIILYFSLHNRK